MNYIKKINIKKVQVLFFFVFLASPVSFKEHVLQKTNSPVRIENLTGYNFSLVNFF